jgi:hypothetical protein
LSDPPTQGRGATLTHQRVTSASIKAPITCKADPDRQSEQPFAHVIGDIGHHHTHPLRGGQRDRVSAPAFFL